jgi:hypothetical protein
MMRGRTRGDYGPVYSIPRLRLILSPRMKLDPYEDESLSSQVALLKYYRFLSCPFWAPLVR